MAKKEFVLRKKYLISKHFQIKYIVMILVFMLLVAWLAGFTVYCTLFALLGEKLADVYPRGRLIALFKTVNITLLINVALLVPFVVVVSVILSHRIAGPLYRIERYLNEVAQGDFSSILKLRKRDELKGVAEAINSLTQDLRRFAGENKEIVDKLSSTLDALSTATSQPSLDKGRVSMLAKEASEQIKDLKNRLSKYRV